MPYLQNLLDPEAIKRQFMPYEDWQLRTAEAEKYTLPDPSQFGSQANLYRKLPTVFLAVDIVASAAALTEFSVARVISGKEPKDIPNHPFEMLLQQPNPLDSRFEFLYATIAYWMLNKNSYWWLNRKDETSPPDEIWVIPPHMIKPIPDENLFLKGYNYEPGVGGSIFLPSHEIIHFRGFNPFSRFLGLSAGIESLMLLAQSYLGMTEWNTKLYKKNNGRLPGVLAFKQQIVDPVWDKIKADTREASDNRELLMLRGVGDAVQWMQNASSQKDANFYEGLDKIDKMILDVLAPGAYTMLYENANEANSRTGRATLNELAIYPKHVVMGEKITAGILPAYGSDKARPLVGHFKDIRVTDRQLEITEQQEYSKTHTISEIREEFYGDDPLGDDRDELLPDQLKTYKSEADKQMELEKKKIDAQNNQARNSQPMQQLQSAENQPPEEPAQKSAIITDDLIKDLARYQRWYISRHVTKAVKSNGTPYQSAVIPKKVMDFLNTELKRCVSEAAVKYVFDQAREKLTEPEEPKAQKDDAAILTLADSMNNLALAWKTQNEASTTLAALKLMVDRQSVPQQIVVYPPSVNTGETNLHVSVPEQGAPQVFNSFPIQIEAAPSPDVKVDSPVYIQQTVEPAEMPEIPASNVVVNNNIEPPAPESSRPVKSIAGEFLENLNGG